MSERRKVGDKVMVNHRRGGRYVCQIPNGHGNDRPDNCIFSYLGRRGEAGAHPKCVDPDCKEWPTLRVLNVMEPDREHYEEKEFLYHVSECEMIGAKGGHDG